MDQGRDHLRALGLAERLDSEKLLDAVDERTDAHAFALMIEGVEEHRPARHAFRTSGDHGILRAGPDGLGRELQRLLRQEAVDDASIGPVDVKMTAGALAGALSLSARWHEPNGAVSTAQIADAMVGGLDPRSA
ncbi:hypothetical protein [Sphingobium sp. Z007]|uniref:hypothetical protein n=1 Tax=Sphingobium sp. Z007 TaxID=627495 RepID=UPI0020CC05FE|nr:hypothetical protein [Sphingobium sp. Z007]